MHSIRTAILTTLAFSLLLQVAYFGSVLFLVWRSSCARGAGQRAEHFGSSQEDRHESPDYNEGEE
ncbi:exopolysaccharide production repressor protein [Neomesorhizobium albiziae]|uniref:exopolysaccharide production repressor protein n=1 Tax=Neomesorhizobium albiziae TaxID=335020 RepID=UPI001FCEB00B|nr:exopolysaccharide production repressor protein [Mesorhizobium albiziae]